MSKELDNALSILYWYFHSLNNYENKDYHKTIDNILEKIENETSHNKELSDYLEKLGTPEKLTEDIITNLRQQVFEKNKEIDITVLSDMVKSQS